MVTLSPGANHKIPFLSSALEIDFIGLRFGFKTLHFSAEL